METGTGTSLDAQPAPVQFAVRTDIDPNTLGAWFKLVIDELRAYGKALGNPILCSTGDKKLTPRGVVSTQKKTTTRGESPRFLTFSREKRDTTKSLISYLYTEVLMAVTYQHHRAHELEDLLILTHDTQALLDRGELDPDRKLFYLKTWYRQFRLCVTRNLRLFSTFARSLGDIEEMITTKSEERFKSNFVHISNELERARINSGEGGSFAITDVTDVILLKQEDFEYPFGISFLEVFYARKELEQGYARLKEMIGNRQSSGTPTKMADHCKTIRERVVMDIRSNLLPALRGIEGRIEKTIEVTSMFVDSLADLITNYIFDMAILYFNYAIAFTDCATGTTIQLRAEKVIFSQFAASSLFPLPSAAIQMLTDLTKHSISSGNRR